jgi:hypothetical protein
MKKYIFHQGKKEVANNSILMSGNNTLIRGIGGCQEIPVIKRTNNKTATIGIVANIHNRSGRTAWRWLGRFLPIIVFCAFVLFSGANEAKAEVSPCDTANPICSNWTPWYPDSYWCDISSEEHWPYGSFKCPIQIFFRSRECLDNMWIHEYEITGYHIDFGYRIWVFPYGWIYPCREAMDLLKGNSSDVSLNNNELMLNLFKKVNLATFEEAYEIAGPNFSPCNPSKNNPNRPHVNIVTNIATCQGSCVTLGPYPLPLPKPLPDTTTHPPDVIIIYGDTFELTHPPIELLAEMYDAPLTGDNAIIIEDIDSDGVEEFNNYVQFEINPLIPEQDFKIPVLTASELRSVTTYHKCIADFCCAYKLTLCIDNNGNISTSEEWISEVSACACEVANSTNPVTSFDCVPGRWKNVYPCTLNGCAATPSQPFLNIASSMLDRISPNPTSNYLDVSLKDVCTNITAEVVDLDGKLLFKLDFENAKDFRINFPFVLPNGTYSLLLNADGKHSTTNFVITK